MRSQRRYLALRLAQAVPVVLGVTVVTFLLLRLVPGDPARTMLGEFATPKALAALRHHLGLNRPILSQFWIFLLQLVHGNFGRSLYYQTPVRSLIAGHIVVTASLVALAAVFAVLITVPLATIAAVRKDHLTDHVIRAVPLVGLAMPSFWVGILLILGLSLGLGWFPIGGWGTSFWGHIGSLVLPALTAAVAIVPFLLRSLRAGMLDVLESDFVGTARAKGLREGRVLLVHMARNAVIPTVTLLGMNIADLIGSTVVVEAVFNLNGLGGLMIQGIQQRDFPVVQGVTFVFAVGVVLVTLLTDLAVARLDPRIER